MNNMFLSIGKEGLFTRENLLFLHLHTPCPHKLFPIDDHANIRMGFLDIEGVSVKPERDLEGVLEVFEFLTRETPPEIVSDKKTGSYTEESNKKE